MNSNNYALIMAGGIGSRFWPSSRKKRPKQFQDFMGQGKTLIQQTYNRFKIFIPKENIFILTNELHEQLVLEQIKEIDPSRILLEPSMKNTAPCILYASLKIKKINPLAIILTAPSDHLIKDDLSFSNNIKLAFDYVRSNSVLITFAVKPNRPDTGYGYLEREEKKLKIFPVKKFIEKPSLKKAKIYLKSENYFWNSGIFVWKVKDIISAYKKFQPKMFKLLYNGFSFYNTSDEIIFINKNYSLLEDISIDYAIMEKCNNCFSIIADFDWSDIGTWTSLHDKTEKNKDFNVVVKDNIFLKDVKRSLIYNNSKQLIVASGLKDFIVVLNDDVLLIYPKGDDQKLKEIVENVKSKYGKKYE